MSFIFRKLYKLFTKVLIMLIQVTAVIFFLTARKRCSICWDLQCFVLLWWTWLWTSFWSDKLLDLTLENSFLEKVEVFLAIVVYHVDAWFCDDLLCWGIYKSIVLKRYKHTTGATEQWEWEVVERKPNKTISSSNLWSSAQLSIAFLWFTV